MPASFLERFNTKAEEQPLVGMVVYSVLNFLRPAIYIFLIPIYLGVFTEVEYGLNDIMNICQGLFLIVVTFRLNAAMLTMYYDFHGDRSKIKTFLRSLFSASFILALFTGLLFYFIGEPLFEKLFVSDEIKFFPYGFTVVCAALISEVLSCYYIFLRNEKNLVRYTLVIGVQILLTIILQLLFVVVFRWGVIGALAGNLVSNVVLLIMVLLLEPGILSFKIDQSMVRKAFKFSVTLIPYLLIYWVLTKGGKFVLERNTDLSTVAVFALLATLASTLLLLTEAVINGLRPFLFEIFAEGKSREGEDKVAVLTSMIINLPLVTIPFIMLIGNNIHLLTDKATYLQVAEYCPMICLCSYLLVYVKLFYQQLIFAQRSDLVTSLSFIVMIVLCAAFYLLVPDYAIWGILWATLVANALMALFFFFAAQKKQPVSYNFKTIFFFPIIIFSVLFGLEYILLEVMDYSRMLSGWIQFFVLGLLVLWLNFRFIGEYRKLFMSRLG